MKRRVFNGFRSKLAACFKDFGNLPSQKDEETDLYQHSIPEKTGWLITWKPHVQWPLEGVAVRTG
ncbi:MAG: hypothetical protein QXU18_13765 [Thermoplasmatales archaeon]